MTKPGIGLDEPGVLDLIDETASKPIAAIFVGAGISMEAGLPSWTQLVTQLLERVAPETESFRRLSPGPGAERRFAQQTIAALGPLGAAAVAKAHLGDEYEAAVAKVLLPEERIEALVPGPTAVAIARLVVGCPNPIPLVTTNYDCLLERALVAELKRLGGASPLVKSVLPGESLPNDAYVVVHLHGLINEAKPARQRVRGPLVLAEDEFFAAGRLGEERRELAQRFLSSGRCLFLGTSLTDPNLLAYLYSGRRDRRGRLSHATIAIRQIPPGHEADQLVLDTIEETGKRRLANAGIEMATVATYGDASQVVSEIDLQIRSRGIRTRPSRYRNAAWSYGKRAAAFEQASLSSGLLAAVGREHRFLESQVERQRSLDAAVRTLQRMMLDVPAFQCRDEQLALHLWIHSPGTNLLLMSAQSEKLSYNPAIVQSARAELPTDYLVVDSFCNGTSVEAMSPALDSGRWGSMIAIPLTHRQRVPSLHLDARLRSGVIVLASTARGTNGLERLRKRATERAQLISALAQFGANIIDRAISSAPSATAPALTLEVVVPSGARPVLAAATAAPHVGSGTHIAGMPSGDHKALGRWKAIVTT